ncbi:aspartyl/asparaginyl beta-hydroxylase isoform X2 [Planococcus citri]|uniref:aspartyl/asparaginyl beta-hydroxylase isoform X2 n=1 Tax=Planococcus citri TaxID=170843 RepID=UPI0031F82790
MSSDSGARKRNVPIKKKKGSAGSINPGGITVREIPLSKPSADELIHVQKDVQFGDNWCKVAVFFAISSALVGVAYCVFLGNNSGTQSESQAFDWLPSLPSLPSFDFFSNNELPQEAIDEEPVVDNEAESSYLDLLWSLYPFGQNDEPPASEVSTEKSEKDEDISKELENDKDSREDDSKESGNQDESKESNNEDELENNNDQDDSRDDHESEENPDDEKNTDEEEDDQNDNNNDTDDENQKDEDTDENDVSNSADDVVNKFEQYKSYNYYSQKKDDDEDDDLQKDSKEDDDDSSKESKEQIDRRDERYNYYHNRESEEVKKYEYIKGEDDHNESAEEEGLEKIDSEENTKDENEEETKIPEDDSHSSEEVEHDPVVLPEEPVEPEAEEPNEEPQSGNMVTKLSVGIALIFVAYSVIIRKWNNYVDRVANEADAVLIDAGGDYGDLADIAQSIADNLLDSMNNDSNSYNEPSEAENRTLQDYLETPSNSATEQSEDESANEPANDGSIPMDSEKSQTASETESETDDDSEYGKGDYDRMNITNRADWQYRHQLDEADDDWDREDILNATLKYTAILEQEPKSVRAQYGMVRFYDSKADSLQSNSYLANVIELYQKLLHMPDIPEALAKVIAERTLIRMRFIGNYDESVSLLKMLIEKYPQQVSYQINLAISYLILNKLPEAEAILEKVLRNDPDNGLGLVNYGFIVKMKGEYEKAVDTLSRGISSGVKGTDDSKFYYHLGEALQRLGRTEEALKLYQSAADKRIFRSKYQRSLYNVNGLKAKPWWVPADTQYNDFFNLERNWEKIRDEVKKIMMKEKHKTFKDEAEQLREKGEWKQLEIFSRGVEKSTCKKLPVTCGLIRGFVPAAGCRRGQVKFSIMEPGTHVWPHCGPTNCRLRAHLGLIVPKNVTIRVAEETRSWREGEVLLFDDSFEHEIWHNGTSSRLILIVDVWHPNLSEDKRKTLSAI